MQNATLDVQQSLSVRSLCTIADRRRRCEVCTEYYSTEYTMSVYETLCVCMLNIFDIGKIGSRMHADEKASGNEYEAPPVRRTDAVANVNFSCGAHTFWQSLRRNDVTLRHDYIPIGVSLALWQRRINEERFGFDEVSGKVQCWTFVFAYGKNFKLYCMSAWPCASTYSFQSMRLC